MGAVRARSRQLWIGGGIAVSIALVVAYLHDAATGYLMDLSVFRDAGGAFLHGQPLYSADFPSTSGFRFIYPPIAAILFAPLAWISSDPLEVLWTVVNLALLWWIVDRVLNALKVPRSWVIASAILGVALLLEPVRSNFGFGQINLVLMALVVADCLGVLPRRMRGMGVGLAAAIKLTPAAFGLVFLLRRDFASIGRAAGTFAATVAIGFAFLPQASVWFWLTEFFKSERAGGYDFSRNQAITGMLARMGLDGILRDAVWLVLAALVVAAAVYAGWCFTRAGEHVVVVGVVALAVLLAAPFAVTHHWIWCVLLVPLAFAPRYRSWRAMLGAAILVFWIAPHIAFDTHPQDWVDVAARQLVGNAQCIMGIVLLIAAVVAATKRHLRQSVPEPAARVDDTPEPELVSAS
ncbi:DUF2029 domain-containing protein [Rhodococcus sp. HNM0569]|nr:glycosyltransferase family 87 protein [Rhodococcus sp. HNM0569]NLU82747.1 DUF2029 domain-containing protein [Rhodococcus sp. HNM0569]